MLFYAVPTTRTVQYHGSFFLVVVLKKYNVMTDALLDNDYLHVISHLDMLENPIKSLIFFKLFLDMHIFQFENM